MAALNCKTKLFLVVVHGKESYLIHILRNRYHIYLSLIEMLSIQLSQWLLNKCRPIGLVGRETTNLRSRQVVATNSR